MNGGAGQLVGGGEGWSMEGGGVVLSNCSPRNRGELLRKKITFGGLFAEKTSADSKMSQNVWWACCQIWYHMSHRVLHVWVNTWEQQEGR